MTRLFLTELMKRLMEEFGSDDAVWMSLYRASIEVKLMSELTYLSLCHVSINFIGDKLSVIWWKGGGTARLNEWRLADPAYEDKLITEMRRIFNLVPTRKV